MVDDVFLDPYRLRQFVAVADRLNITRAAEDLHLSQQAVSSSIKNLERDLGVILLERAGRRIALTPEGNELLTGARVLLDASRSLVRTTRKAGTSGGLNLSLGYTPAVEPDEVYELTAPVRSAFPEAKITARQLFPGEIDSALRSGAVDVILRRGAGIPNDGAAAIISYTPLRVAVAASHRLSGRASISLRELESDVLMLAGRPGESFYADYLLSLCRRAGFEPQVAINRVQGTPATTAVIDTNCFAFVSSEPGGYHLGKTVVIAVENNPMSPVQAIWLRHTRSRMREALISQPSEAVANSITTGDLERSEGDSNTSRFCLTQSHFHRPEVALTKSSTHS